MSSAWPEEAVWLRLAAPMMVMGAMPLASAMAPGFVMWRLAMAGPLLASGLWRTETPEEWRGPVPWLRLVGRAEAPSRTTAPVPGRGGRATGVTLAAVPDCADKA